MLKAAESGDSTKVETELKELKKQNKDVGKLKDDLQRTALQLAINNDQTEVGTAFCIFIYK